MRKRTGTENSHFVTDERVKIKSKIYKTKGVTELFPLFHVCLFPAGGHFLQNRMMRVFFFMYIQFRVGDISSYDKAAAKCICFVCRFV